MKPTAQVKRRRHVRGGTLPEGHHNIVVDEIDLARLDAREDRREECLRRLRRIVASPHAARLDPEVADSDGLREDPEFRAMVAR